MYIAYAIICNICLSYFCATLQGYLYSTHHRGHTARSLYSQCLHNLKDVDSSFSLQLFHCNTGSTQYTRSSNGVTKGLKICAQQLVEQLMLQHTWCSHGGHMVFTCSQSYLQCTTIGLLPLLLCTIRISSADEGLCDGLYTGHQEAS